MKIAEWFKTNLGFTIILNLIVGILVGCILSYFVAYKIEERTVKLGTYISVYNNKIYTLQERP